MHELSVIENILNISFEVAEENELKKIDRIHLTVGKMQHLNEMILNHAFSAAKLNTIANEAELIMEWLPVKIECQQCKMIYSPDQTSFSCPFCHSQFTRVIQGTELQIKSIEGE